MKPLKFNIPHCPQEGCSYNKKGGRCMLNNLDMVRWRGNLHISHDSDVCAAKRQLNEHRLEQMLDNK